MGEMYFIADTHFGHKNALEYDNRPFSSVDENDETIKTRWNETVGLDDDIYILGDFSWYNSSTTVEILKSLNGIKHLIVGNHDGRILKNPDVQKQFVEITPYKEIRYDDANQIVLCHYPMVTFKNHYRGWFHFYGHVHNSWEWKMVEDFKKQMTDGGKLLNMHNVGCMMPWMNYTPRTAKEIIAMDKRYSTSEIVR